MRSRQSPAANVNAADVVSSSAARRAAMFATGLAGLIAFNVIIGVFGLVAAGVGLLVFIVTALFVIARSSRREKPMHD